MKETRYFYAPDALAVKCLPDDEAGHALRVLRLGVGDEINVIDGAGNLLECTISDTEGKHCLFEVNNQQTMAPEWQFKINIAVAPTKNMDRMEWFVEKATEIGVDRISLLNCQFSERKVVKTERLDKIVVSAMKQSHKFYKPVVDEMVSFKSFVEQPFDGLRFIAHCYEDAELLLPDGSKPFLLNEVAGKAQNMQVLVGPEGDFSAAEVKMALQHGFVPISLGTSRLRTETAALVAVHLMRLSQQ